MDYLSELKKFYRKNHRLPSYSEMLKIFRLYSKNSIFKLMKKLINDGFIEKIDNKFQPTKKFFSLPILGIVKAGMPVIAEENREYLTLEEYLIEKPDNSFLLKVSGDSLIESGIYEGDIAVIERNNNATIGDIVLAEIDREWTLKILKQDRKRKIQYLEPANRSYPSLYPKYELKIHGILKAVVRKYRN